MKSKLTFGGRYDKVVSLNDMFFACTVPTPPRFIDRENGHVVYCRALGG